MGVVCVVWVVGVVRYNECSVCVVAVLWVYYLCSGCLVYGKWHSGCVVAVVCVEGLRSGGSVIIVGIARV
jgi:hypothetical protein